MKIIEQICCWSAICLVSVGTRAETGTVIDRESGKPIAGAHVFARWFERATNPVQSSISCSAFAIAQTDVNGRYVLPDSTGISKSFESKSRGVTAYAPGYEFVGSVVSKGTTIVEIQRYKGATDVRLLRISQMPPLQCSSKADYEKLLPLYEAMYEEAKEIAKSPRELEYRDSIRANMLRIKLGDKEFKRRNELGELFK